MLNVFKVPVSMWLICWSPLVLLLPKL